MLDVCERLELDSDTIDLAYSLLKSFEGTIDPTADRWLTVARHLARALYRSGRFSECAKLIVPNTTEDGELLLLHALSHLIAKEERTSVSVARTAQQILAGLPEQQDWMPLLVLAEAVAL